MKNYKRFATYLGLFFLIVGIVINIKLVSYAKSAEGMQVYLPVIRNDPTRTPTMTPTPTNTPTMTPTPTNTPLPTSTPTATPPANEQGEIANGSFEEDWSDLPPAPGYLINQQPSGWQLTWVEPGQPIFDSNYMAQGVPECVHKLEDQLPPHEQPGGSDPLILAGTTTYKIFHYAAAFGAELQQQVSGLTPGQTYRIIVPLRIHGVDSDPWGAESGIWIDGVGEWVNQSVMGDRTWYYHTLEFTAVPSGEAVVTVRVKSKYNLSKDFFVDNIQLEAVMP